MDIVSWKLHYISLHNKHGCQTHIKWNQFILYGQCILNEINVLWVWWQKGSILVMHLGIWVFSCKGSFCLVGLKEGLFIKMVLFAGSSESGPSARLHVWKRINTIIQFGSFILSFVCNKRWPYLPNNSVLYCSDLFLYPTQMNFCTIKVSGNGGDGPGIDWVLLFLYNQSTELKGFTLTRK